jgi:hypothetical protein
LELYIYTDWNRIFNLTKFEYYTDKYYTNSKSQLNNMTRTKRSKQRKNRKHAGAAMARQRRKFHKLVRLVNYVRSQVAPAALKYHDGYRKYDLAEYEIEYYDHDNVQPNDHYTNLVEIRNKLHLDAQESEWALDQFKDTERSTMKKISRTLKKLKQFKW